jgi:hypothetical protein
VLAGTAIVLGVAEHFLAALADHLSRQVQVGADALGGRCWLGSPSGAVLSPEGSALLGRAAADLPAEEGYVIAPFDPAWSADSTKPARRGWVETVAIADRAEAPMQQITAARAILTNIVRL